MTPRSERTAAFEAEIAQEWSEYYFQFMTKNDGGRFYLDQVLFSANINITMKTIKNHPEYEWSFEGILSNGNLTWEFMKTLKNGELADDDECLMLYRMNSIHYNEDYVKHADLREKGMGIKEINKLQRNFKLEDLTNYDLYVDTCYSDYVHQHHLLKYPNYDWHYTRYCSCSPNMTIEFFQELVNKKVCLNSTLYNAAQNAVFTYTDIKNNPQLPWKYQDFGMNGSLRFDFIINNPTIFDGCQYLNDICLNVFSVEKAAFLERRRREYMAAYRIQQWWLRVTSHPANVVCQRRLERDYAEMFQVTPN